MNKTIVFQSILTAWVLAHSSWSMDSEQEFFNYLAKGFFSHLQTEQNLEMPITIKTEQGHTFALFVKPIDSINNVIERIKFQKRIPRKKHIRITYSGLWLGHFSNRIPPYLEEDPIYQFRKMNTTLLHYGIKKGAVLFVLGCHD